MAQSTVAHDAVQQHTVLLFLYSVSGTLFMRALCYMRLWSIAPNRFDRATAVGAKSQRKENCRKCYVVPCVAPEADVTRNAIGERCRMASVAAAFLDSFFPFYCCDFCCCSLPRSPVFIVFSLRSSSSLHRMHGVMLWPPHGLAVSPPLSF